jgi:hypothetical protein
VTGVLIGAALALAVMGGTLAGVLAVVRALSDRDARARVEDRKTLRVQLGAAQRAAGARPELAAPARGSGGVYPDEHVPPARLRVVSAPSRRLDRDDRGGPAVHMPAAGESGPAYVREDEW